MNKFNLHELLVLTQLLLCSCNSRKGFVDNACGIPISIISLGISIICVIICVLVLRWSWMIFSSVDDEPVETSQKTNSGIRTKGWNKLANNYNIQRNEIASLKKTIRDLEKAVNDIKYHKEKRTNSKSLPQVQNTNNIKSTEYSIVANESRKEKNTQPTEKQCIKEYIYLKVIDGGKLVISQGPDNAHYRAWTINGTMYFEFHCSKTGRAINNRTSIIVPFCDIIPGTIDPDSAQNVIVDKEGILNDDLTVSKKVLMKYF